VAAAGAGAGGDAAVPGLGAVAAEAAAAALACSSFVGSGMGVVLDLVERGDPRIEVGLTAARPHYEVGRYFLVFSENRGDAGIIFGFPLIS
jgi:hypothetical protein